MNYPSSLYYTTTTTHFTVYTLHYSVHLNVDNALGKLRCAQCAGSRGRTVGLGCLAVVASWPVDGCESALFTIERWWEEVALDGL